MATNATDKSWTPVHHVAELARMLTRSRIVDACETSELGDMTRDSTTPLLLCTFDCVSARLE
jgi:hypothetical protein